MKNRMSYRKYHYTGPIYYYGNTISKYSNMYTTARSYKEARKNFLFRIANGDIVTRYDIVDRYITLAEDDDVDDEGDL